MDNTKKVNEILGNEDIPLCVDIKINEAREIIRKENRKKKVIKRSSMIAAASFVILLGIGITNPLLADKIPFLGNAIDRLRSNNELIEKMPFIVGANSKYASSINEEVVSNDVSITVQEAYCDGSNIFISYIIKSDNNKLKNKDMIHLGDVANSGDIKASFSDEKLSVVDSIITVVDEDTYVGVQYIDLMPLIEKGVNTEDEFDLDINISKLRGFKRISNKEEVVKGNWGFKLNIKKDDSKNIKYEPNLENNKAILKKLVLTPATTEVEVDIPKEFGESAYVLAYDDKGKMLEGHTFSYNIESKLGMESYKKFTPISEDSEYIVIHIVDKSTKELKILAEFKILLK